TCCGGRIPTWTDGSAGWKRIVDNFKDRVAVVTGGASGIGRALALAFAREGARVVLADLDDTGMAEVAGTIRSGGGQAVGVRTDVSDLSQVQALADKAWQAFGAVHILCNNAGVGVSGGLEEATLKDWQWVLGVNLWGVIHGLLAFLPRMIAQKQGGHIVNTASMAGLIATQGLGVYNTTKYAVVGLSETLVKDLKPYGIGVSVLCPMGVDTRILDSERNRPSALRDPDAKKSEPVPLMGRTLSPEEVAAQVLAAIRANQLYVITHAEGLEPLRRRFQRMGQAIPKG
ncbi:MAG: SDR family NAD(P)-dependent oxidoreductase, partial [candidate division NC10 bacterium]